jgi:hypothetical protein
VINLYRREGDDSPEVGYWVTMRLHQRLLEQGADPESDEMRSILHSAHALLPMFGLAADNAWRALPLWQKAWLYLKGVNRREWVHEYNSRLIERGKTITAKETDRRTPCHDAIRKLESIESRYDG